MLSLELKAVVDVLGYSRSVSCFEQVHVAHCALGGLASAADIIFGGYAFEIDVPAVELALSHDEVRSLRSRLLRGGSCCRSSLDGGSCGLSLDFSVDFLVFFAMIFEVFGV